MEDIKGINGVITIQNNSQSVVEFSGMYFQ